MNAVIYCRVSSRDQTEGTSLDSQDLACREFARAKRHTILKVFVEQGESAKFADRTQLLELIDFCRDRKNHVEVLLVWKVDRFARNVTDHFNLKATLLKYGVQIVSVTEPIDGNAEGKLMETILAGFAQFDNDIRAIRCVQGMRRKLQEGLFPWKAPLGYKSLTQHGDKKTAPDQPNHPVFGFLQKAWRAFASGGYTKADVRRLLDHWGVVTCHGQPLSAQAIDQLLANPYYAGLLVDPWSGERHPGRHVPMITEAEFARVQEIVRGSAQAVPHLKIRPEFPLRGVVRCSACHHYLTASFSRGRSHQYPYYHCFGKPICPERRKSHPAREIHCEFESFLGTVTPRREVFPTIQADILRLAGEFTASAEQQKARIKRDLAELNRQTHELIQMRTAGLITDDEFRSAKEALWTRQLALENRPVDDALSRDRLQSAMAEIFEPLTNLPDIWATIPVNLQSRFVQFVLPVGFVRAQIRTAELGLLFRVFAASDGGLSNGVAPTWQSTNRIWTEIRAFLRLLKDWRESQDDQVDPVRSLPNE